MFKWAIAVCVCLALLGCAKEKSHVADVAKAAPSGPPADPVQALYEKVHSGSYQIGIAIDDIEDIRKTVRDIAKREKGDTHQALLTVAGQLDEAGKALADFGDDPPAIEVFKQNFGEQDDKRLKAIDAANEALDDLDDAQDLLGDLLDSNPPEPENTQLSGADDALDTCIQTIEDAIKAMGGRVTTMDP